MKKTFRNPPDVLDITGSVMYNKNMTTNREFQNLVDDLFERMDDVDPDAYAEYGAEAVEYDAAIEAGYYPSEVMA